MSLYVYNDDIITCTAPRDISVNEFVVMGRLAGFAKSNVKAGQKFALVRRGVFEVEVADAGVEIGAGVEVYFADGSFTTSDAAGVLVGITGGDVYAVTGGRATVHMITPAPSAA